LVLLRLFVAPHSRNAGRLRSWPIIEKETIRMLEIPNKMKSAFRQLPLVLILLVIVGSISAAQDHRYRVHPWSFGVMGDTQWTLGTPSDAVDPAGNNPNYVSVSIIHQLNQQFIRQGVKFVVELGDLSNWAGDAAAITRANAAADLYNHRIGFFPMRGNHETYGSAPSAFIPLFQNSFPQTRGKGDHLFGATHFSSPFEVTVDLNGMSYSFDYQNARFVILDVMPTATRTDDDFYKKLYLHYGYPIGMQQGWIRSRLNKQTRGKEHAFVLTHQPLIAETHFDSPFGGYLDVHPEQQNAFCASLQDNGVKYYLSAHDHLHQRSVIASPDGQCKVEELIAAPASSKFYSPVSLDKPGWKDQKSREMPLSQELNNIGYYIYTVDGPRVTVDYYSDARGNYKSDANWPTGPDFTPPFEKNVTPVFNFAKKETWGYSLNGREFMVPESSPYTSVADAFQGTSFRILSGANGSTVVDGAGRPLIRKVTTGWTEKPKDSQTLKSNILSLWGLADLGANQTDTYTLSLTLDATKHLRDGSMGIATVDDKGNWVNAVNMNSGGKKKFVAGPYKAEYGLGTYGIDTQTQTAWAVINYTADFAVAAGIEPSLIHKK
jgi:hypothetical protein